MILIWDDIDKDIGGPVPHIFELSIHIEQDKYETVWCDEPLDVPDAPHECVYLTIIAVLCGVK